MPGMPRSTHFRLSPRRRTNPEDVISVRLPRIRVRRPASSGRPLSSKASLVFGLGTSGSDPSARATRTTS